LRRREYARIGFAPRRGSCRGCKKTNVLLRNDALMRRRAEVVVDRRADRGQGGRGRPSLYRCAPRVARVEGAPLCRAGGDRSGSTSVAGRTLSTSRWPRRARGVWGPSSTVPRPSGWRRAPRCCASAGARCDTGCEHRAGCSSPTPNALCRWCPGGVHALPGASLQPASQFVHHRPAPPKACSRSVKISTLDSIPTDSLTRSDPGASRGS